VTRDPPARATLTAVERPTAGGVAVTALLALAACSGESTSAAPPTKICGHTVYSGARGMFTYDVWTANNDAPPMPTRLAPVPAGKILPALLLRVAPDCRSGAALTIMPSTGLKIVRGVTGHDGRPVAIAVQGGTPGPVTLSVKVGARTRQLHFFVGPR
jgi:hypothetical protein